MTVTARTTTIRRKRLVVATIGVIASACGSAQSTSTATRDVPPVSTAPRTPAECERWLQDDVVAPDLAAAADAVRAARGRDFPGAEQSVQIDHATPPRIRVQVTGQRDEIEAAARAAIDPKLAPTRG